MRKLTILGATGSIGSSTLAVVAKNPEQFEVTALAAGSNVEKCWNCVVIGIQSLRQWHQRQPQMN